MPTTTTASQPYPYASRAPGPAGGLHERRGWSAYAVMRRLRRDPIAGFEEIAGLGDAVLLQAGGFRMCTLNHPDLIAQVVKPPTGQLPDKGRAIRVAGHLLGNGLLNSEGDFHLRQRRMAQPAFQPRRLAPYVEPMVRHTREAIAALPDGEVVAMEPVMSALTLRIAGETMFGVDLTGDEEVVAASLAAALDAFTVGLHPLAPIFERIPLPIVPPLVRVRRARERLLGIIARIVRERHAETSEQREARGDLLSLLLQARDDEGRPMPDAQLHDEALTLLLAGHETTANALAWSWRLLAENPGARALLDDELARVLGGREPTLEDVESLEFTRAIFCESLRLYPPGPAISRSATSDLELQLPGDAGERFTIRAGSEITMPQWVVHRDARWFDEPHAFRPERFLDGSVEAMPKFAWFPFGGGRRVCIGQGFALLEGVLVLATMAPQVTAALVPHGEPPRPVAKFTVRPHDGAPLVVRRR